MIFNSSVARVETDGRLAVLIVDAPPVNALGLEVRLALVAALAAVEADQATDALVIACAGRTFFAGADIREFGSPARPPFLPDIVDRIEAFPKPIVAAIHGAALGGGLEVALACHFRVATPSALLGLPEVKLGLMPGAGGTQRLPRLVGVPVALDMMTSGAPVDGARALAVGLLDTVAPEDGLVPAAIAMAREAAAGKRPIARARDREEALAEARAQPELIPRFLIENARRFRNLDAPKAVVEAVTAGLEKPFEDALAVERSLFRALRDGPQSKALRYAFLAEHEARKIPGLDPDVRPLPVESVGIVGAGTMGTGIALNFLLAGLPVTLVEVSDEALERGRATIARTIARNVEGKRVTQAVGQRALALLATSLDHGALATQDLLIEAAFETMTVKREIFRRLDQIARPGAILATNTSFLDVDAIAAETTRAENVLGLHFFSPANIMKLLEIVRAARTSDTVLATALALARTIGKVAVVAGVGYGFIGNRMLAIRKREADRMMLDGVSPYAIDRVLEEFGMPMGPFRMADLAGLDIGWSRERSTGATVRERLCERDRRGQKTGAGFYDYDSAGKAIPSPIVEELIQAFVRERQVPPRRFGDDEILVRLLYPVIDEAARILEEGKAHRASDIDVVWLNGYGWPAWRGGPMFWADTVGLREIETTLTGFAKSGDGYAPSALLTRLAAEGQGFAAFDAARKPPVPRRDV